jgi:protein-S-isoprenylcysteine O-methyltransferase Ste14
MKPKIAPFAVFLITVLVMYALKRFLPFGYFDFFGRFYLMGALLVVALIVGVTALLQFYRANTTVNPMRPENTRVLVTNGVYAISRNPMYFALLLVLLAWGLWLGNAFNTLIAAGFVSFMNKYQISLEEKALAKRFAKEYGDYLTKVRRWF